MLAGILGALWLLGLFAAAPLLRASAPEYGFADRLRDALILGVAIPLALGTVHLLYAPVAFAVLAGCAALPALRDRIAPRPRSGGAPATAYLTIAAAIAVAWPQLMRPLLDGDSLSYHLPNAAAWTQAHSLWMTATRYWWYPPASELFASGLYLVSGPFALPWSGACALALLGARIFAWTREAFALSRWAADALAAATVTCSPLALQGGTLQNDVWLAAFFVESLWSLRASARAGAAIRSVAVTALIKPQGWVFAAIALIVNRAPARFWCAAAIAAGAWLAHDALLLRGASILPAASAGSGALFGSTLLAHGLPAVALLARVAFAASPFFALTLVIALAGPLAARNGRALGWASLAALAVYFVVPFGYETSVPQLATGYSLRVAAAAAACGALLLAGRIKPFELPATLLLAASAFFGICKVLALFWNDGSTQIAPAIAVLGAAICAAVQRRRVAWPIALSLGLGIVLAAHLAARHPIDYYDDALTVNGTKPGVYRWIARARPPAIGGWGLRLGVVNVLSPATRTRDLLDQSPCAQARVSGVLLVAVAQNDLPPPANAERLAEARACGLVLYEDPIAVAAAVLPHPH